MSKSLIYTVNSSAQDVAANGIVSPGTINRRFGCNFGMLGNAIAIKGNGYYTMLANIVLTPAAIGNITATLLKDGVQIPGATATGSVATVGDSVTLAIPAAWRECCCCEEPKTITCQISTAATVENFTFTGVRE